MNVAEMRRKFPAKKPPKKGDGPNGGRSAKAIKEAIAREYELKKAELKGGAPVFRKGPLFYLFAIVLLVVLGSMVLTASKGGGLSFGKKRIELKPMQARSSMDALTVALGRYRFHVGSYPSTKEGLAVLALKSYPKAGWDGPYINHVVNDPWGNEYVYEAREDGGHPVLYSKGPNGRAGDDDDVLPDQSGFEAAFRDTSWTNEWAPYRLRGVVVAPDKETKELIEKEMKNYDRKENGK